MALGIAGPTRTSFLLLAVLSYFFLKVPTEAAVRLELTREDAREAAAGGTRVHGSSMSAFLAAGMQLENSQFRIRREQKARTLLTLDREEKIEEMQIAFEKKSRKFRLLQQVHMPRAIVEIEAEDDRRNPELPPPNAEDVKLWMPSELPGASRSAGCRRAGLPDWEAKLQEAQCSNALEHLIIPHMPAS
ncbi:hypothetical protein C8J57DRAFT_1251776 [Mycena rebaudengoi]|nr:hypothetical protein C8J57DRAFT_1251776 [Mycena rebaudengoi]